MKQTGDFRQKTKYSFRIVTKLGKHKWVEIYSKTIQFGGSPANFMTMLDISDRKRAEEALQESEERFRTAFHTSPDAVNINRLSDGLYVDVNIGFTELTGFTRDEVIGKTSSEINLWHDPADRDRLVEGLKENEQVRNLEAQFRLRDGQVRTGLISARIIVLNEEPYILSVTRDVDDWKKAEEALLESEKRYRDLFDNSADLIYTHDLEGKYTSVNKAVERLLGYTPEEFLNLNFRQILDPDYLKVTEDNFRMKVNGHADRTGPYEVLALTKAGQPVWLGVNSRIMISEGRRIGIHGSARDITDRKLAEEKLKQEREFTDAVIRSVPGLLYLYDETGHLVRWNKQHEELTGYSAEEMGNMHVLDWFGGLEPDTSLIAQRVQETMEKGGSEAEANLITKDGRSVPFYFTGVKLTISGKPYFTGIGIDITERRRAEHQIRLNEARLQSLYNISQYEAESIQDLLNFTLNEAVKLTESEVGYIYFYDEEKKVFELNSWSKQVMKECEVAEPQTLYELEKTGIWGEAVRKRKPIIVNDFRSPNPLKKGYPKGHVELHNFLTIPVLRDERIVAVVGVANKTKDYDESDVRQLALLMDAVWRIAEARRSELEQRRSATALEFAAEGVIITDIDGTIQYVNPSLERMTGYARDELLGNNPRVLKSGVQEEAFYEQLWRTIKGGGIWNGRFVNKKKDGTLYTEDATISPVRDASGEITNFVGMKRDITDHLALSKQLFHAQKMEAIGTLAGGIAHDFNNLLQAILGYSDILLIKKARDDPDRKKLEVIQHAARDGADLVGRILTFSRKSESKIRPIDLNDEIRRVEKLLRRTLPRMIQIDLMLGEGLRIIDADPAQIEQVILNLGVNAQYAMPKGGQLLIETSNASLSDEYLRTHLGATPGHYVLLAVSDTGVGIEPAVQDRIFEPFFTTKTNGEGTGLGLAMVHGIISQHGGYIRCYSEPGRGTSFKIYFPVSSSELISDVTLTREMPAFGTETILLVDDDDRIRGMGRQMIEMGGYEVITARSGEEALELYGSHGEEISLIVLDLIMPGMGGTRCLEELLRINAKVKVLVASGYSSIGLTDEEKGSGARGFVSKPYDAKDILGAIRKVLDKGHL
jgi:two-component system, cell cycle sensor histidine kinase and response regulator CckA